LRLIQDLVKTVRQKWQYLLQGSAWIMTLLAGFVLTPPIWDFEQHLIWYRFTHFIVAALIGLMFIPITRWPNKRYTSRWALFTLILLILGVVLFFQYQSLRDDWTVAYDKKPVIIGKTYSRDALNYKEMVKGEENREVSDRELVMAAAGRTENLWNIEELHRRGRILAAVYVGSIAIFTVAIISLIQALYCNSKPGRRVARKNFNQQPAQNRSKDIGGATPTSSTTAGGGKI
jgi:hypothetical protein